ncbi:hypothetical protein AcV5_008961 [Taiwanofungus camphoratus]|nr:hypothetical protein AcV5_008961 [Antrodia cinnamomea]
MQNITWPVTTMPLNGSSDMSSFVSTMLSFSALRDWFKLLVIGGLIETCRRIFYSSWQSVHESFWLTASFDDDDTSYNWILFWLSQHPSWSKARTVEVTTRNYGLNSPAISVAEEDEEQDRSRRTTYLPSLSATHSIWYKHHYMVVSRNQIPCGYYRMKETLQISILCRDNAILDELLVDAKKIYKAAQEHLISVYMSDLSGNWKHIASRPKRPLNSIILEPGMKEMLLNDAREFLQSKNWYSQRGIPFRRGYLLYGAPGSGKTSLIQSVAGELGLDVYIVSLSRAGLDDNALGELISDLPTRCIALMEDIDAAFHQGITRERRDAKEGEKEPEAGARHQRDSGNEPTTSRVSLSGLLNALDGIAAQEGRILFATTNHYSALDPALCRPGRMDVHIEFKLASKYQANELFRCFYMPSDDGTDGPRAERTDEKSSDSGYRSRTPSIERQLSRPESPTTSPILTTSGNAELESNYSSHSHRSPLLSYDRICGLAAQFANTIPEREFSMAGLQGYLMMYKIRPYEAANEVSSWVEKERAERARSNRKTVTGVDAISASVS